MVTSDTPPAQEKVSLLELDFPVTVTVPPAFGADMEAPLSKEANSARGDCETLYVAGVATPVPVTVTVPVLATRPVWGDAELEIVPLPLPVEGVVVSHEGFAIGSIV